MALTRAKDPAPQIDPAVGIVQFRMNDGTKLVPCMVTVAALRNRAAAENLAHLDVKPLFWAYWREIERIAATQYDRGVAYPVIRSVDLAPPPPLPHGH